MRPTRAQVLAAVIAAGPAGLTSADLSEKFSYPAWAVAGIATRLAAYGAIDKQLVPGQFQRMLWKPKEARA